MIQQYPEWNTTPNETVHQISDLAKHPISLKHLFLRAIDIR